MSQRVNLLAALIFLLSFSASDVLAQKQQPKFRSNFNSNAGRTSLMGLQFVGGAGLSVVNSDNRIHSKGLAGTYQDKGFGWLGNNGAGPSLSAGIIYKVSGALGYQGNLDYMMLIGQEDRRPTAENKKLTPDIPFRTHGVILSTSVVVDLLHVRSDASWRYGSNRIRVIEPYVKAGVGAMVFGVNSTELENGIESEHRRTDLALVLPLGVGFRYQVSTLVSIAPEFTFYVTTTDYLDNVSNSEGYTGGNDNFGTASVKVFYKLIQKRRQF